MAAEAPYERLRDRLLAEMRDGTRAAGSRLPTVRALAEELGLAPGTVARAYKELEAAGAIETRGRNGTLVAWSPDAGDHATSVPLRPRVSIAPAASSSL
ncbi:MAG: GntR family transcriptional regulator [Protaetiibacter sp.]